MEFKKYVKQRIDRSTEYRNHYWLDYEFRDKDGYYISGNLSGWFEYFPKEKNWVIEKPKTPNTRLENAFIDKYDEFPDFFKTEFKSILGERAEFYDSVYNYLKMKEFNLTPYETKTPNSEKVKRVIHTDDFKNNFKVTLCTTHDNELNHFIVERDNYSMSFDIKDNPVNAALYQNILSAFEEVKEHPEISLILLFD